MITILISVAAVLLVAALLVWVSRESARAPMTTWVCAECLQGFSSYEDAGLHLQVVHPRPR